MTRMTLEELLTKTPDGELVDIFIELHTGVVPTKGAAHGFCRKVNKMIDRGDLCISPTTYRRVYLPTLAKAVKHELSYRYVTFITHKGLV